MTNRHRCLGLLALASIGGVAARGDAADEAPHDVPRDAIADFRSQYAIAGPKVEAAYANVSVEGTSLQFSPAGQCEMRCDLSLSVAGGKFCKTSVATTVATKDGPAAGTARAAPPGNAATTRPATSDLLAGTMWVELGTPDLWLSGVRTPSNAEFRFTRFGKPDPQKMLEYQQIRLIAATGPYCVLGTRVGDLLRYGAWKIRSVETFTRDGKPRVTVRLDNAGIDPQLRTRSIDITFDPTDWCVTDYIVEFARSRACGQIGYDARATFPRPVKTADTWTQPAGRPEQFNHTRSEATTYTFGPPPAERFTLRGLGVNTLPPVEMMK